jgi:hypothetical protein
LVHATRALSAANRPMIPIQRLPPESSFVRVPKRLALRLQAQPLSGGSWVGNRVVTRKQQLVVLACLLLHENQEPGHPKFGLTWPSPQTIAEETNQSERMVQYILRALEVQAAIKQVRHPKGGRGNSIHYQVARA